MMVYVIEINRESGVVVCRGRGIIAHAIITPIYFFFKSHNAVFCNKNDVHMWGTRYVSWQYAHCWLKTLQLKGEK